MLSAKNNVNRVTRHGGPFVVVASLFEEKFFGDSQKTCFLPISMSTVLPVFGVKIVKIRLNSPTDRPLFFIFRVFIAQNMNGLYYGEI